MHSRNDAGDAPGCNTSITSSALRCPCKIYSDNAALFDAAADVEWLLGAATELVKVSSAGFTERIKRKLYDIMTMRISFGVSGSSSSSSSLGSRYVP